MPLLKLVASSAEPTTVKVAESLSILLILAGAFVIANWCAYHSLSFKPLYPPEPPTILPCASKLVPSKIPSLFASIPPDSTTSKQPSIHCG